MIELKPCPFCGGEAKFVIKATSATMEIRGWAYRIACSSCKVETPKLEYTEMKMFENGLIEFTKDGRSALVDIWNARKQG